MTRLNVNGARRAALFVSGLQRSDAPTGEAVAEVISRTVRQFGVRGCASRMAQEFGDHPEAALDRMRWVRQLVGEVPAGGGERCVQPDGCAYASAQSSRWAAPGANAGRQTAKYSAPSAPGVL
jgi:hypothetical protein